MTAPRLTPVERASVAPLRRAYAAARSAGELGIARDMERSQRHARRFPSSVRWGRFAEVGTEWNGAKESEL